MASFTSHYFHFTRILRRLRQTPKLAKWLLNGARRLFEQTGRSEIFGGMDANCRFTVCPDDYDEEGVVGPAGAKWNKQSRHAPIVQKMLTEIGCYLPSTFHGCGDFATYYWYGKVAGEDSPNVDGSRIDFLFVKNKTRIVNGCVLRSNEEQWFQQVR